MSVLPIGFGSEEGGYRIERSLRFNSSDSAFLNRTPASAGNRKTWTWSGWVKRSGLSANGNLFGGAFSSASDRLLFEGSDKLWFIWDDTTDGQLLTTQVFRDVSAWYHIVIASDTTQATASNRMKFYVNGVQITVFDTATYPSQNRDGGVNNTTVQRIGVVPHTNSQYLNGYLTEINFIDGSALDPTSFGEYNEDTGVWQPKAYTGSYGTNGFYLNFSDNSGVTSTTLGADSSGNGNNWTPNNFSVTAGAGNDSLVDTPTNYGVDTGAGGEVRGNYATLNPLTAWRATKPVNGNLEFSSGSTAFALGTMALSAGKWYCEVKILGGVNEHNVGFVNLNSALTSSFPSTSTIRGSNAFALYSFDGKFYNNGTASASLATFAANDIIMLAYDADNSKIYVGRNGTWLNSAVPASGTGAVSTTATAPLVVATQSDAGDATGQQWNFGQRPFAYTAPSGFKALCTQNLPEPTIVDGGQYFNTVLYTGNGSSLSVTGVGFQPDWVWGKSRSNATNNFLYDSVRGVNKRLISDSTAAETDETGGGLSSFNSDGFTVQANSTENGNARTFVAWNWKANGAGVSNTAGTISSTVSVNTTSGFSIVTYTGTGSAATVGHGLGAVPRMIIVKNRDQADAWQVYHAANTANPETDYLVLNTTAATADAADRWNDTLPTSTVFSIGDGVEVNTNTEDYVAYVFAAIPGYSAFGSYTGNGNADGPFVYTGFRPAFVMVKSTGVEGWGIWDNKRDGYNVTQRFLLPNLSNAEQNGPQAFDFVSNGFKVRGDYAIQNTNAVTYIFMAFAENPYKVALAR